MIRCYLFRAAVIAVGLWLGAGPSVSVSAATLLELQNPHQGTPAPKPASPRPPVEKTEPSQPGQPARPIQPTQPGGVIIVPPAQLAPANPQGIMPTVPQPQAPTIVVPTVPIVPTPDVQISPVPQIPQTPGALTPIPPAEKSIVVPVVPTVPTVPVVPGTPDILPEPARPEPKSAPDLLTPEAFLLKTPEKASEPEKKPEPEKKSEPQAPQKKPESKVPEKKPEPKAPPIKPEAAKPEANKKPQPGEALNIPEDAKQTGNVDFLEGCWVGTRPEYNTKRIITERFCFDKSGVGKRYIIDPEVAGNCIGATRANIQPNGVLQMTSEKMYCTSVEGNWAPSRMTCQGEGEQTPCTWVFDDTAGARQSYSIRFVRE